MFESRSRLVRVLAHFVLPVLVASALIGVITGRCPPLLPVQHLARDGIRQIAEVKGSLTDGEVAIMVVAMITHYVVVGIAEVHHIASSTSYSRPGFVERLGRLLKLTEEIGIRIAVPVIFCGVFYLPAVSGAHHGAVT